MAKKIPAKRIRPAKNRTLPPDAPSLIAMIRSVHRQLRARAAHFKTAWHDTRVRDGFKTLHTQRSMAWIALYAQQPSHALALAHELGIHRLPLIAQPPEAS